MSDWNKLLRRVDAFLVTIPGERRARELHEDISAYLNEKPHEPARATNCPFCGAAPQQAHDPMCGLCVQSVHQLIARMDLRWDGVHCQLPAELFGEVKDALLNSLSPASPPHAAAEQQLSPRPGHASAQPSEEESALWEALGAWSAEICRPDAELAPPQYLLDAVMALASPSAQPIARDEQDAKRYRWLREHGCGHEAVSENDHGIDVWLGNEALDQAIDAALKSAGKE